MTTAPSFTTEATRNANPDLGTNVKVVCDICRDERTFVGDSAADVADYVEEWKAQHVHAWPLAINSRPDHSVYRDQRPEEDRPSFGGQRLYHFSPETWVLRRTPEVDTYPESFEEITTRDAREWLNTHGYCAAAVMSDVAYYFAGASRHPGTNVPSNVMGDCGHHHRSPETAERCLDKVTRAVQSQGSGAYCDRVVMVAYDDGTVLPLAYAENERT